MVIVMFAVLLVFCLMGIPVAFGLGLTALITIILIGQLGLLPSLVQAMYVQTTSFTLLAIPFFIVAGTLMNRGGMTDRILAFCKCFFGFLPGGLAHVNVAASMLMAGMSGSAIADAGGLGKVIIKAMSDAGYQKPFSTAITAASSTVGPVIPPSIPFVIYGAITGVSVGKLFLGGILPGVAMGLVLMGDIVFVSHRERFPREKFPSAKEALSALIRALPALGGPVIIIGGLALGVFTPTEASVALAAYSLLWGAAWREITLSNIASITYEAFKQSAQLMFIIATAAMFGWLLTYMHAADQLVSFFTAISPNPKVIVLMMLLLVLLLGFFMEGAAIILSVGLPLSTVASNIGVDPVHFGIIFTLSIMVGLLTPPVGLSVLTVSAISGVPSEIIFRASRKYMILLILLLVFISFFPPLTLFVPNLFMK